MREAVNGKNDILLDVRGLSIFFRTRAEPVRAVEDVSFDIEAAETVALVGESGCGKSITALALAGLLPPSAYLAAGEIRFKARDITRLRGRALRELRGAEMAYIFQDPAASLNPVFRIGAQIAEALRPRPSGAEALKAAEQLLRKVGFASPARQAGAYPHQLSGGMQQRAMIAMALAGKPELLIADEPTTALDVTIQAQILEMLGRLQSEFGMAILLITHNLALVAGTANRIFVMYAGRIVESGPARDILRGAAHPYTRGLLGAVPRLQRASGKAQPIRGAVPAPGRMPEGCRFHPRCDFAGGVCRAEEPREERIAEGRTIRCHFWRQIS